MADDNAEYNEEPQEAEYNEEPQEAVPQDDAPKDDVPKDDAPKDTEAGYNAETAPKEAENDVQIELQKKDEEERGDLYDADGDGIVDDEMFEGSTHGFAIHFARKRNTSGLIIAYFVFAMQMVLYIVCAQQVIGDLSGSEFTIPVNVRFGKKCTDASNLVCPPDLPNLGFVALAAVLLAFFLMHDILASFRIFATIKGGWAKVAGFIILFESLFAALIGAMFAVQAGSGYDAIANCVGVLFIHDADEKAFEAFMIINAKSIREGCCGACCRFKCCAYVRLAAIFIATFIIMVVALVIGSALRAVQKGQIIEVYGDDYWDNAFSSGSFTYDWGGSSTFTWDSSAYFDTGSSPSSGGGISGDTPTLYSGPSPTMGIPGGAAPPNHPAHPANAPFR